MLFESRVLHLAKDLQFAHEYEDAFEVNPERGLIAIADGVSSGIFTQQWASLLTESVAAEPPDLYDTPAFQEWLASRRNEWLQAIDFPNLAWNQRAKLNMVGGAYATLLWVEIYPPQEAEEAAATLEQDADSHNIEVPEAVPAERVEEDDVRDDAELVDVAQTLAEPSTDDEPETAAAVIQPEPDEVEVAGPSEPAYRMRCFAVGDCCLFHIRDGRVLRTFPMTTALQFEEDPVSVSSVNFNRDHLLEFGVLDEDCQAGDLLWVCTDAIGKWAMSQIEAETPPDWNAYWDISLEDWTAEVEAHRVDRAMRRDDSTLILLRIGTTEAVSEETETTDLAGDVPAPNSEQCDQADQSEESADISKTPEPAMLENCEVLETPLEELQARIDAETGDEVADPSPGETSGPAEQEDPPR